MRREGLTSHLEICTPQPGFDEQVYYLTLNSDSQGMSKVALRERRTGVGNLREIRHHAATQLYPVEKCTAQVSILWDWRSVIVFLTVVIKNERGASALY